MWGTMDWGWTRERRLWNEGAYTCSRATIVTFHVWAWSRLISSQVVYKGNDLKLPSHMRIHVHIKHNPITAFACTRATNGVYAGSWLTSSSTEKMPFASSPLQYASALSPCQQVHLLMVSRSGPLSWSHDWSHVGNWYWKVDRQVGAVFAQTRVHNFLHS